MSEPILHHYPQSPFAEKGRLMLGFKRLAWRSVKIPRLMPKPDLIALTGGYRRTPVLQLGADIHCDTALIARVLDRIAPEPPLLPPGREAAAAGLAQFADEHLFLHAVGLNFRPDAVAARFTAAPPGAMEDFMSDRKALFGSGNAGMLDAATANAAMQWPTLLSRLEAQLAGGAPFLLGTAPCVADLAHYHPLWFVVSNPMYTSALDAYPHLRTWMRRIAAVGHGTPTPLDAAEAIAVARAAEPQPIPQDSPADWPGGLWLGRRMRIAPADYGVEPTEGELVACTTEEIVLRREDPRAGIVHVHFPRFGYRLHAI